MGSALDCKTTVKPDTVVPRNMLSMIPSHETLAMIIPVSCKRGHYINGKQEARVSHKTSIIKKQGFVRITLMLE
jgi:hypothetical protein